jgi:hypothetical protein
MSVPPATDIVGKCFLISGDKVARVLRILPGNQVHYELRSGVIVRAFGWKAGVLELNAFAHLVEREVPCDWTPEGVSEPSPRK